MRIACSGPHRLHHSENSFLHYHTYKSVVAVNSKVESRYSVSDATPEAEVTYVMTSTPCVWRDSAHAPPDIHKSPAPAVNYGYFKSDISLNNCS